ncbi:MAG: alpha-glucan family phosphorylase [Candidatus Caenarcaniphilales bacterium]|jgi:phosphorylase/glycogen(starch) synthase|nr:alpha-glucan family phosphorylase [Candidatus Caenarcaniphilales bacterium]
MKYIFEVSWEVCNKVGGIYTVVSTKAPEALKNYGDGYIALGPDIGQNFDFEETNESFFDAIKAALNKANIPCRFGRWKIPGKPRAILVGGFKERFNIERLLFAYWNEFGADSYEGGWDYVEPVLFSTTCGEVIEAICKTSLKENDHAVAHFHEWMCGAGVLYLRKNMPKVGTVFTTHATMLGRSMAHHNPFYYHEIEMGSQVEDKAYRYGVKAKHSMECMTAKYSDCFTTVSEITARECYMILGRDPDLVVYNGMDVKEPFKFDAKLKAEKRKYLLKICESFFEQKLPDNTQLWVSSGRYEFKNKGYDLTIDALSRMKAKLGNDCPPIVMMFLVAADNLRVNNYQLPKSHDSELNEVAISPVYNKEHDAIVNSCHHHGLDRKDSAIKVMFSTLYLDGQDGIFNMRYEDILEACDLSLFPSFYEPWGYTPLESAVVGIPTITSDLSGFGYWTQINEETMDNLIMVLPRRNKTFDEAAEKLAKLMYDFASKKQDMDILEKETNILRAQNDWSQIFPDYKNAYDIALGKGYDRELSIRSIHEKNPFAGARCHIQPGKPILRCFSLDVSLPEKIRKLNDLAYNLWWCWDDEAQELFKSLNPDLWEYYDHNPIRLLKSIPPSDLENYQNDLAFVEKLDKVYERFKNYMGDTSIGSLIDLSRPSIAYLSMEFGLHESLPIYSGGLGILAGDHLKSASDMNLNMIGIGLFYKNGYFVQEINHDGYQVEHYPELDWKNLPVNVLLNQAGEAVKIPVDFPEHVVWTKVLVVRVGRVPLFLFDTNLDENREEDRHISGRLYVGDRETRLKQEILIGIAGVRLLKDVLGLDPAVYHLNEGHCAFITVELLRRYALQGYSFESAVKAIQNHTIFTTHTPVAAGNEAFAMDQVRSILNRVFDYMHMPIESFMELGRNINNPSEFSMTVLALRVSRKANSVSKLHEDVSREMWSNVFPSDQRFFNFVTNGVHMPTWLASRIKQLCKHGDYLDFDKIHQAPNELLWKLHQEHKKDLISNLKDNIKRQYLRRGLGIEDIKRIIDGLDENVLTIGFARRFAEYKRASLLFRDPERLIKILSNTDKPLVIVYGGKSHPANGVAKELIKEIYKYVLDERFIGKLLIIENYNMHTGRLLTGGVDVWLNNPIMRQEACGTSGMKAAASGVLNLSLPDGWWAEGYRDDLGWKIEPASTLEDYERMCDEESDSLYKLLEQEVIPMYYAKNAEGYSEKWVERMKVSIAETGRHFSANRMLEDYNTRMYIPVIKRSLLTSESH